ncbi:hypothetical protein JHK82_033521 [Glycine max]|uniref:Uncharacterized protein n=1 Tax=Glycine max TaxID=3847 RepID=A0A0R0H4X3_SOYBN|nr:hypothetical protein JHK85_034238 [Glycine max]KAG4985917.1 hypothetical protein JHK86_033608 [Glycine max]KAG5119101.1 hypothetical protein JHK82_033521 [Glycine max]KAG5140090.1 hypothetical protein JHK84_033858 [Glycine max]
MSTLPTPYHQLQPLSSRFLTSQKLRSSLAKTFVASRNANKVCHHTLLSSLSNDLFDVYCSYKESREIWDSLILIYIAEDVVRQRFIIANYYRWTMNNEKDIKVQINEYHKLLRDLKTEDEFISELLIEKLYRVVTNNNPLKPGANLIKGDDIIATVISQVNVVTHVNKLVVDSRATRHICANKSMLTSYTVAEDGEGKGKVLLKLTSRKHWH